MTNLEISDRLNYLTKGSCAPHQYIRDFYGLAWPFEGDLKDDYEVWSRNKSRIACPSGSASRFEIEAFMQHINADPEKMMAAKLGMTLDSFRRLAEKLPLLGLRPARFLPYPGLAASDISEFLIQALKGLRFRTFSDHNAFCEQLHNALRETGITIDPLFCETSKKLGEDIPQQFANYYDCITLEPLSVKHQVWLDFHKPLSLAPDRCSKLTYVEYHVILKEYRAGRSEPTNLDVYEHFAGA